MLRLDEAIAAVADRLAKRYANQYLGGGTDIRIYSGLGADEAEVLRLVYKLYQEDLIAEEVDAEIRRRIPIYIKLLGGGK